MSRKERSKEKNKHRRRVAGRFMPLTLAVMLAATLLFAVRAGFPGFTGVVRAGEPWRPPRPHKPGSPDSIGRQRQPPRRLASL